MSSSARRNREGFTLIELVVVMAVLTVLAGLVLPKLDIFKLKANKAQAASNMHGISRFVEGFRVQRDRYPDGWDSLMDLSGTALYGSLDPQLLGTPPANPTKLATTTIASADELRSLDRLGIRTVYDHDPAVGFPGDSATTSRTLSNGDTVATINAADSDGAAIIDYFYPTNPGGTVPANKKLVVFGLGPRNNIMGDMLQTAPFYANTDQIAYYNRFLCVFEIDTGGSRARFLGALGADGDRINEEIIDFYEN